MSSIDHNLLTRPNCVSVSWSTPLAQLAPVHVSSTRKQKTIATQLWHLQLGKTRCKSSTPTNQVLSSRVEFRMAGVCICISKHVVTFFSLSIFCLVFHFHGNIFFLIRLENNSRKIGVDTIQEHTRKRWKKKKTKKNKPRPPDFQAKFVPFSLFVSFTRSTFFFVERNVTKQQRHPEK